MAASTSRRGALLVRYDEIGLKGGNRGHFERLLQANLRSALAGQPGLRVRLIRGRALVHAEVPAAQLAEAAAHVFGVSSLSPAVEAGRDLDELFAVTREQVSAALASEHAGRERVTFRLRVNRADKTFPLRSPQLEHQLGQRLVDAFPALRVDLAHAELEVGIDIRDEGVWVFSGRQRGPGGLPVSSLGRGLCLLSGGIDSPVAAWLAMKRGLRVEFASFYSFPLVGPQVREKVIRLVELLARWQPLSVLHVVPFADYQVAIRDHCPARYRTVLYRRAMNRIASALARRRRCGALVTGESLGQVASQTTENLALIEQVAERPVLRPLICHDKNETVELARRLGTFEISAIPAPDCCTLFQPEQPVIYGRAGEVEAAEADLDHAALVRAALRDVEQLRFQQTP